MCDYQLRRGLMGPDCCVVYLCYWYQDLKPERKKDNVFLIMQYSLG